MRFLMKTLLQRQKLVREPRLFDNERLMVVLVLVFVHSMPKSFNKNSLPSFNQLHPLYVSAKYFAVHYPLISKNIDGTVPVRLACIVASLGICVYDELAAHVSIYEDAVSSRRCVLATLRVIYTIMRLAGYDLVMQATRSDIRRFETAIADRHCSITIEQLIVEYFCEVEEI